MVEAKRGQEIHPESLTEAQEALAVQLNERPQTLNKFLGIS